MILIALFPASKFSEESLVHGGFGLFGFEFFFVKQANPSGGYFIEIGSVGTGATADKLPMKPVYSNGLSVSGGLRFYF